MELHPCGEDEGSWGLSDETGRARGARFPPDLGAFEGPAETEAHPLLDGGANGGGSGPNPGGGGGADGGVGN